MGAIKDVIELLTQLAGKVKDRKVAAEIVAIQKLTLDIQAEHAQLHEANIKLREERLSLKENIQQFKEKIAELSSAQSCTPSDVPICPNCSTNSKPYYMSLLSEKHRRMLRLTHECPKCKYQTKVNT